MHYRINAAIGAGGMGEVYRAADTKLGREVALKVLPANVSGDPERLARFQREARTIAALNHRHIVTLFSVEESAGVHFLTMEFVQGEPLDRLIPAQGLPGGQILDIAAALAEALTAAHEKGIVHRDLKPANVMVTPEGQVKVLDFGLAKELASVATEDATMAAGDTHAGVVMGTPAYMSPEQVACRPLDHRSDIFSLGIILHEMATGHRPFSGDSSAEIASAILRDNPPPVTEVRSDLPSDLCRIIRRCLEKDPRHRYQTARDISNEFRDLTRAGSRPLSQPPSSTTMRPAQATDSGSARAEEGFWTAVLPFKYAGSNGVVTDLAQGLTEDIITGLSRFSYMRVIARGSSSRFAAESTDLRAVGRELGARYILEGTLRQAGSRLRISVQLVDAATGAHLWAEVYDRAFQPEAIFDLQDDLVPRIVSTVADTQGILPRNMGEFLRSRKASDLTPYEAVLRSFAYLHRITSDDHLLAREALELAVQRAPEYALAWAMLAVMFREEYSQEFNLRPNALEQGYAAARRAVEIAPSDNLAFNALASIEFLRKDFSSFRASAERAVSLNPMDGFTLAYMGFTLAYSGDWEKGCALTRQARSLNPHHPGWYWFADAFNAFRQGDYKEALTILGRVNMPTFWRANLAMAATYGYLGEIESARAAYRALIAAKPQFASSARIECEKWWQPSLVDQLLEGLRKAGLPITEANTAPKPSPATPASGSLAVSPSIAVLPFVNMSGDKEQEYFSDGLAEEILNALTHVSGLKVIARTSAFAFKGKDVGIREIAQALNVALVLEGSVRRSGNRLRVTAQLIRADDGSHIWSERYDRELSDIFAIQDEISASIAAALRLKLSPDATTAARYQPNTAAYEAYLKGRYHEARITPDALETAQQYYEQAGRLDPGFALAHIGLGTCYLLRSHFGTTSPHETAALARREAERALALDPSLPEAHALLGWVAMYHENDWEQAERHLVLGAKHGPSSSFVRQCFGYLHYLRGNHEPAIAIAKSQIQENPLDVWAHMNLHGYLQSAGRDEEALEQIRKALELDENLAPARVSLVMFLIHRGDLASAVNEGRVARAKLPWYPEAAAALAAALRLSGEIDEAHELLATIGRGEKLGECRAHAFYHLMCGDIEQGADWTEKALAERDYSMIFELRFVVCRALRVSSRWPRIAEMMNLPLTAKER